MKRTCRNTAEGKMYVDVASATNSCQSKNRTLKSLGADPCAELETRGGVWVYDAKKTNQTFSTAERFATGIRNAEGFAIDSSGQMFVTQHGRDQLRANWPDFYTPDQEATLPSEELLLLTPKGDYGWPECYHDPFVQKLVLSPEYGGDGKTIGICANKIAPIAEFPAHCPRPTIRKTADRFPRPCRILRVLRLRFASFSSVMASAAYLHANRATVR
jgi:glucose/arabinose dehydrogenase